MAKEIDEPSTSTNRKSTMNSEATFWKYGLSIISQYYSSMAHNYRNNTFHFFCRGKTINFVLPFSRSWTYLMLRVMESVPAHQISTSVSGTPRSWGLHCPPFNNLRQPTGEPVNTAFTSQLYISPVLLVLEICQNSPQNHAFLNTNDPFGEVG
jgi:hypothetical protein